MICKVKRAVERYLMPLYGKKVVVGLSGGADSMALLHVLLALREEYKITVVACHVNHGIRGKAADNDEAFVTKQCKNLGVELHTLHENVPELAKKMQLGVEECGRQVRYGFFNSIVGDGVIATAHTLSDRCETLLLNMTRGTSVKGICSIPPIRGNIVRPLIDCTRADIERYCDENSIEFITDETNFDDVYSRNRVRLRVIPELKKLNPSVEEAFLRLIKSAEDENDFLATETEKILAEARKDNGYCAETIKKCHRAIRYRVLFEIISREKGILPEEKHLEQINLILDGGRTQIIGDTVVEVKNGTLLIDPVEENTGEWECDFSNLLAQTPQGTVKGEIVNKNNLLPKQSVHNKVLDYNSTVGTLVLRNRRAGDKMRVAGSSCTKTLKKLFNEKHLDKRNSRLVLADDLGVAWVQGIGCADRCKIKDTTNEILVIREEAFND